MSRSSRARAQHKTAQAYFETVTLAAQLGFTGDLWAAYATGDFAIPRSGHCP
ncbi:hypothetical protein [Dinoroseobacter sp. S76]|uniref:hypothetical protein n=1 Tax=Dinoroseobacter sp. S76 TaxID=3415124 RepID=UPI003C7E38F7